MFTLGDYEIQKQIGKGGYGTVYLATEKSLGRQVALKILHPQMAADLEFIERFRKEARLVASIENPHVVTVHAVGEAQGSMYIAMRYYPGGNLGDLLKKGPLSWEKTVAIIQQIFLGLQALHKKGWVHRDLKPSNILFDTEGRAVVADFGLARSITGSSDSTSGGIAGTPFYRAPELWRGKPPASPATDIYSLGCILAEMLIGHAPFGGETPDEVITKHLVDGPDFGEHWPPAGCSQEVRSIVEKAIARKPEDRYQSVEEFSRALLGLLQKPAEPHLAQPIPDIPPKTPFPVKEAPTEPEEIISTIDNPELDLTSTPKPPAPKKKKPWWALGLAGFEVIGVIALFLQLPIVQVYLKKPTAQPTLPVPTLTAESVPTQTALPLPTTPITLGEPGELIYENDFEEFGLVFVNEVSGDWSVIDDGYLNNVLQIENQASSDWPWAEFGPVDFQDGIIQYRFQFVSLPIDNSSIEYIYFRLPHNNAGLGYTYQVKPVESYGELNYITNDSWTTLSTHPFSVATKRWYEVKVTLNGPDIQVNVDGDMVIQRRESVQDRIRGGRTRLAAGQNVKIWFDDIKMWNLASP